jgi:hypothetical protein
MVADDQRIIGKTQTQNLAAVIYSVDAADVIDTSSSPNPTETLKKTRLDQSVPLARSIQVFEPRKDF